MNSAHERSATGELVVIQRNPTSGSGRRNHVIRQLTQQLRQDGYRVRLFASRQRLDHFVRSLPAPPRCLVAAGGDGTVNDLASRHPGLAVAVLPMGTENLLARHLNIPCQAEVVRQIIHAGQIRNFDLAQTEDQPFLLMASAGLDADIVHRLATSRRGNIRHTTWIRPILCSLACYRGQSVRVTCLRQGITAEGGHVIISNFPEFGLNLQLNPQADPHDGQLDVCVFRHISTWRTACYLAGRIRRPAPERDVIRFRSAEITLQPAEPSGTDAVSIPVQTDGDPAGHLPQHITVAAGALRLLVRP